MWLWIFSCGSIFAQSRGYVVLGDSARHQGMLNYDPSNPFVVEFHSGKVEGSHFNASEISAFGYMDGPEYISRTIPISDSLQPVFLEILEGDGIKLLTVKLEKDLFFLEDDSLISLHKYNYSEIIKGYSVNCARWRHQYKLVKYRKSSLRSFFDQLNAGTCRNIPFTSFGVLFGSEHTRLSFSNNTIVFVEDDKITLNSSGLYGGLFAEVPVYGKKVDISLAGEVFYGRQIYTEEFFSELKNQDLKIDLKLLNFSLSPKFTFNTNRIRPYLSAGGDFSYALESNSRKFQANFDEEGIIFSDYPDTIGLPKFYYGFSLRSGIHFFYLHDHYVTLEAGYSGLFSENSIRISRYQAKLKINI